MDYLFYQGMALARLGRVAEAQRLFEGMVGWAEQSMGESVEADFFAVSLPDLIVLDDDPQHKHRQHCLLVRALGLLGLGQRDGCEQSLRELLTLNPAHDKGHLFALICRELSLNS
ncbi:Tetratricopeptide repeat protein [compost metagenome]